VKRRKGTRRPARAVKALATPIAWSPRSMRRVAMQGQYAKAANEVQTSCNLSKKEVECSYANLLVRTRSICSLLFGYTIGSSNIMLRVDVVRDIDSTASHSREPGFSIEIEYYVTLCRIENADRGTFSNRQRLAGKSSATVDLRKRDH
jgi:hypothetical protein